ncbi:hypothetical protein BTH42_29855 [Burkholderia sp. SRS-W-2-2016]|uniref:LssY C-terminal domain-containing protein n=1 Tax=Burkholderia sp. SRS-W-2-2016 TaxID=1926878 RepID=UPI00094AE430|nr:LssY C-terminal domain-containing protein [Burkholderia sp. SRS-W-2-2016]OLL27995.1 hypothetical protein BTH42_29855 [Burkholderia sp. SRS-W-2-2016]
MNASRRVYRLVGYPVCWVSLCFALAGCSTWQSPASTDASPLRARAVTASGRDVRVSAAVLGSDDSKRMFGADLNAAGIQPVWIEVVNTSSQPLWLLRTGTDPRYFSPREVAWSMHSLLGGATNARMDEYFDQLGFRNPIPAGATHSGLLFTNPDRGTKLCNIDLFADRTLIAFSLFLQVPDDAGNPRFHETLFHYADAEVSDYDDLDSLRAALERLPCCATDAGATAPGDPLNAVFVGPIDNIGAAFVRRGYHNYKHDFDFAQRLYGREPDIVLRKREPVGAPATRLRGWLAPVRFRGQAVYVAQIGRPVGGRFTSGEPASGALQADVDEARNLLVQDMVYSGGLERLGFVYGVGPVPASHPRTTLDGSSWHTDGLRAVLFFATRPLGLADVEFLDWVPYLHPADQEKAKEKSDERR